MYELIISKYYAITNLPIRILFTNIFYIWNIYNYTPCLFTPLFFFFSLFFSNLFIYLFSLHFCFEKLLYKDKNKMVFTITIATLSRFLTMLKINLKSYMYLLIQVIFILFYYM